MAEKINPSVTMVSSIEELLLNGNCKEALRQVLDPLNTTILKDTAWDIIPVVVKSLQQETVDEFPSFYDCCVEILEEIAMKAQPEEALLEFIEQAECVNTNLKFTALLKPMQRCLYKLPSKRGTSLQWCLNTILSHTIGLSVPENKLQDDNGEEIEDPDIAQIMYVYNAIISFYKPFVAEVSLQLKDFSSHSNSQRKSLVCFIVQLLGKPLMHLDLEIGSKTRSIAEELVADLSTIIGDLFMFLPYVEQREMEGRSGLKALATDLSLDDYTLDEYQREERIPTSSIAVLLYLVHHENINLKMVPCVYCPLYVLQMSLYLSTALLKRTDPEDFIIRKGLLLSESALSRLSELSVPFRLLDSAIHKEFSEALTVVSIYNLGFENRKLSIKILRSYLFKFDMKGRYLLMSNLIVSMYHSSLIGYVTLQLKDMIIAAMSVEPIPSDFTGRSLMSLLKKFISLPDGEKSDLADLRDQILAALNLLLVLLTRDKNNITGIWSNVELLEEWLLVPLRRAIELSRAHYKLRLTDLQEGKTKTEPESKMTVTMLGGGGMLPPASDKDSDNMTTVVHFALNGFDLMESSLVMVQKQIECGQLSTH